jgi:hypothetical protein
MPVWAGAAGPPGRRDRVHVAVVAHAGYAWARGAPGTTVHPWAAASLHHYTWVSGGPPARPGEIVLTAPTRLGPGRGIVLQTADGQQRFMVSGVIRTGAGRVLRHRRRRRPARRRPDRRGRADRPAG